jgi:4-hydroxybenzoate polyprenyltransferase
MAELEISDKLIGTRPSAWSYLQALRLKHWSKNFLLLVPLILSHRIFDAAALKLGISAAVIFGLAASAIYVLNDLLDLPSDRTHSWKKLRPFASGELSIATGFAMAALLATSALALAVSIVGLQFFLVVAGYIALSIVYSIRLKQQPIIDVLVLACFYTIRIFAGGVATQVPISSWLVAFSMFFFFSLAMAKRYSELLVQGAASTGGESSYQTGDKSLLSSMGIASAYVSVLVVALYVHSPEVTGLYRRPELLWLVCPILMYWTSRIWLFAFRGMLDDDPVVIALQDHPSLYAGLAIASVIAAAIFF